MNIIGARVKHATFGEGVISEMQGGYIKISFGGKIKMFGFNERFGEYVYVYDDEVNKYIDEQIIKHVAINNAVKAGYEEKKEQRIVDSIDEILDKYNFNKEPICEFTEYDTYSSNSLEIYLRICKGLKIEPAHLNAFGTEGALLYAGLSADYSLWFIPYPSCFDYVPYKPKPYKCQFWDTVRDGVITERYLYRDMEKESTWRITFVKYDGMYQYYGVYAVGKQEKRVRTFYKIKGNLIASDIKK